jgi:uncharacterized protein with HEPN domain
LADILEAIERIERYVQRGRSVFDADELIQTWVLYHLQVIGEASRALPQELRDRHPEIDWRAAIGMRNILAHHYFGVDPEVVWTTVTRDLPELKQHLQKMLATAGPAGGS